MTRRTFFAACAASVTLLALLSGCGGTGTTFAQNIEGGTPTPGGSEALALNNHLLVAGRAAVNGEFHAVVFERLLGGGLHSKGLRGRAPGTFTVIPIGSFGAPNKSFGTSLNRTTRHATGNATSPSGSTNWAFLFDGANTMSLGAPLSGDSNTLGLCVDDTDVVYGTSIAANGTRRAVKGDTTNGWSVVADPTQFPNAAVVAVNSQGWKVGVYDKDGGLGTFIIDGSDPAVDLTFGTQGWAVGLTSLDSTMLIGGNTDNVGPWVYDINSEQRTLLPIQSPTDALMRGINDFGSFGKDKFGSEVHGCFWNGSTQVDLGTLGDADVFDLNDFISPSDQAQYTLTEAVGISDQNLYTVLCNTKQGVAVLLVANE